MRKTREKNFDLTYTHDKTSQITIVFNDEKMIGNEKFQQTHEAPVMIEAPETEAPETAQVNSQSQSNATAT